MGARALRAVFYIFVCFAEILAGEIADDVKNVTGDRMRRLGELALDCVSPKSKSDKVLFNRNLKILSRDSFSD